MSMKMSGAESSQSREMEIANNPGNESVMQLMQEGTGYQPNA